MLLSVSREALHWAADVSPGPCVFGVQVCSGRVRSPEHPGGGCVTRLSHISRRAGLPLVVDKVSRLQRTALFKCRYPFLKGRHCTVPSSKPAAQEKRRRAEAL